MYGCYTAVPLSVECNTSYDRASDILTVFCFTLIPGQTITGLQYSVNGGDIISGGHIRRYCLLVPSEHTEWWWFEEIPECIKLYTQGFFRVLKILMDGKSVFHLSLHSQALCHWWSLDLVLVGIRLVSSYLGREGLTQSLLSMQTLRRPVRRGTPCY